MPAPLWEVFRPGRQQEAFGLGIRVLPLLSNACYEEKAFEAEKDKLSRASRGRWDGVETPFLEPDRLFSTPLEELNPMERPLVMATRFLKNCSKQSKVRLLCLIKHSICLLQFRHLVHVWSNLPVMNFDLESTSELKAQLAEFPSNPP